MRAMGRNPQTSLTSQTQREDARQIRACLDGDESAYNVLVQRYQALAYHVARNIVRSHQDADDVAQDAFLKAYKKLDSYRGDASFKTWLLRIVTHTALNHRRTWWSRNSVPTEPERLEVLSGGSDGGQEVRILEQEQLERVLEAIKQLPARQQETVRRRLADKENYAGIAESMGVSVGTVKANFHHAVKNLKKVLEETEDHMTDQ